MNHLNPGQKITLLGVGALSSVFLLSKWAVIKSKKPKLSKHEERSRERASIQKITSCITFTDKGSGADNVLYSDSVVARILPFLSSLEYISTVARLSKYHYLYLHHTHHQYDSHKYVAFQMLHNESEQSWNLRDIQTTFACQLFADIYHCMYRLCNDWKYMHEQRNSMIGSPDRGGSAYRGISSHIIDYMICVPFAVPNIAMVKYCFRYISDRSRIPIRHLCFDPSEGRQSKRWRKCFVSALEHPRQLNLFLWIIVYNLYQLNVKLNTNASKHVVHANYFGFEHALQEWLVCRHLYTFLRSDLKALMKLYHMVVARSSHEGVMDGCFVNHMVYVLCIMFKVIFHNTELHIVRVNRSMKQKSAEEVGEEWNELEKVFLQNLYHVLCFVQYVVQINSNDRRLCRTFKSMLTRCNVKMVKNILLWFQKVNGRKRGVFYIAHDNPLCLELSALYWAFMGLQVQEVDEYTVAVRLLPATPM